MERRRRRLAMESHTARWDWNVWESTRKPSWAWACTRRTRSRAGRRCDWSPFCCWPAAALDWWAVHVSAIEQGHARSPVCRTPAGNFFSNLVASLFFCLFSFFHILIHNHIISLNFRSHKWHQLIWFQLVQIIHLGWTPKFSTNAYNFLGLSKS